MSTCQAPVQRPAQSAASGLPTSLASLPSCSVPQTGQKARRAVVRRTGVAELMARASVEVAVAVAVGVGVGVTLR
jgi:hypothetical protein